MVGRVGFMVVEVISPFNLLCGDLVEMARLQQGNGINLSCKFCILNNIVSDCFGNVRFYYLIGR